ncbi:guanitoxin biosynthesis MATE family efflux transporter GntT [Gloeobacter violaceus]|uniref:DNA-damage-inducible protein n=1 Tax=Gloeobacter violaceus (strain ATCC 29082 / PCC 7421) TaxID=251221 RepID=Q7NNB3_GLOVI|nr:guanitoxin biosynthesis MATE family efflux transporter GntT [Gloeobacter violaceus]BAC88439.1 DNA-damage-inducible protein [Gloeobacter violaceus PCC 7421]
MSTQPVPAAPPLVGRFWRLSVVNVLSNLMVPLAGLISTAFLGHLPQVSSLAGVALATVLFNYIYWTFGFLRMGTTGLTAQAAGQGDHDRVLLVAVRHWLLALALGIAIVLLQAPLRTVGFALLSAAPDVKEAAYRFYDALIWGAPATLINFVLVGWFLGREQSGRVLVLTAITAFANVALDYLFIVQWGWQSAGAGAATAISQYLALAAGLAFVAVEVRPGAVAKVAHRIFDLVELQAIFSLNRDLVVRTFVLVTILGTFTNLGAAMGTDVLAANAVLMQVVSLAAYFIDGVAFATESLAGYFKGGGNFRQLRSLLYLAGAVSFTLGVAFALVFIAFPGPLFGLLTDRAELIERLARHAIWLLPVLAVGSLTWMLDGYFLGLTESKILRTSAIGAAVGFVPLAALAWQQQSEPLLWLAVTTYMVGRLIPLTLRVGTVGDR